MKYIKTYNQLTEGLRDKMIPKSDEEIKDALNKLSTEDRLRLIKKKSLGDKFLPSENDIIQLNAIHKIELIENDLIDKKYYPSKEDILEDVLNLPTDEQIEKIFIYNLDFDLLPRGDDGWCEYYGDNGSVFCSENNLKELPDKIYINGDFDCSHNNLEYFPENFIVTDNLICFENKLKKLPEGIGITKGLYCGNNQLEYLPNDLSNLENLEYLDCSNNKIKKLPDNLAVKYDLYCIGNELTELPKGLNVGNDCIFEYNKITSIPRDIVAGTLYLGENPIDKNTMKPNGVMKIYFN